MTLDRFKYVIAVDFEFGSEPGNRPEPVCMVAKELRSGVTLRMWRDELLQLHAAPFETGPDAVVIAHYSSAEVGCFLELGWPDPEHVIDTFAEFRAHTNGTSTIAGSGLLGALAHFGLPAMEANEKHEMRQLAMRGPPWTHAEMVSLLDYCEQDVLALERLLSRLGPHIDVPHALIRGRYMRAAARIERLGIPMDVPMLQRLRSNWEPMKRRLIERVDALYGVYDDGHFKTELFESYLRKRGLPWPRHPSGAPKLDADTFREMAMLDASLMQLKELRATLGQLRLEELSVGRDGRNRYLLSTFGSTTGRNQPSNTKGIFGPAVGMRGLIKPEPGFGLAYCDWSQQEFGIGGALSGDEQMMLAYTSGDPYLEFARQAGAVPPGATKDSHAEVRDQFKQAALGVQYGMGAPTLAFNLNVIPARARELLELHRRTYPRFWRWSERAVDFAMLTGRLHATLGWATHVGPNVKERSLGNFPMQANGAEMLRLACCFATERGVAVNAPVHDALLIEAPLENLDEAVAITQEAMSDASAVVLGGFRLRSDAKVIRSPERFMDEKRGRPMWETIQGLLRSMEPSAASSPMVNA
jgi:DNA polymerase I